MNEIIDEVINTLNNPRTQAITTGLSLIGYNLKDLRSFSVRNCYKKMKEMLKNSFREQDISEKSIDIMFDSLLELEEYLYENKSLDNKAFEKILKVLINGIKVEDELTREYIKILKNFSNLDLKIFEILFNEKIIHEYKVNEFQIDRLEKSVIELYLNTPKEELKYYDVNNELKEVPKELLEKSIENLIKNKLIKDIAEGMLIIEENSIETEFEKKEFDFLTGLGNKIIKLLNQK